MRTPESEITRSEENLNDATLDQAASTMVNDHKRSLRMLTVALFAVVLCAGPLACSKDPEKEELRNSVRDLAGRMGALEAKVFAIQDSARPHSDEKPEDSVPPEERVITAATFHPGPSMLDDPFVGNKRASTLVMVFSNFQCKPCRLFHKTSFQELRERYVTSDDVQLVYRDFPLENNEFAIAASSLAHCAGEGGGYWKMFDILVRNEKLLDEGDLRGIAQKYDRGQADRLVQCATSKRYDEEVALDRKDGEDLGAKGAPGTFVGRRQDDGDYQGVFIRGAQPAALIDQEIRKLRGKPGGGPPKSTTPQEIS